MEDQPAEIDDFDFLDLRRADYDFDDPWPEERVRFLAADRQQASGEHYWWLIRAFGLSGRSRVPGGRARAWTAATQSPLSRGPRASRPRHSASKRGALHTLRDLACHAPILMLHRASGGGRSLPLFPQAP